GNQVQPSCASAESGFGSATPLAKNSAQNRFGRSETGSACAIASSQGKASDIPAPRRNVRRSRCQDGRAIVTRFPNGAGFGRQIRFRNTSALDDINDLFGRNRACTLLRLKRLTGDDQFDQRGKTVLTITESRRESIGRIGVGRGECPRQCVS